MITIPACVVCVAPMSGRARPLVDSGAQVERGDVVAAVDAGGRSAPVRAPRAGRVGGPLTNPQQHVTEGEALVWLSR